ncbi:MAG TPA: tyrosinase family protein [Terriglobales bacterium]|nr:tyrosinase family protein [Terriglobales bacterium]
MTSTSRRTFLKQAAAVLPLVTDMIAGCGYPFPRMRYNVLSAQGQAMIRKYARAVQIMKSRPSWDPWSWTFWWYTHASPLSKSEAIQQVFGGASSPASDLAQKAWWTCQPHQSGQNTDNFLPWHRMYVYFFELQIGAVLGDDTFTLPYWNVSPGLPSCERGIMPQAFRSPDDPLLASLYLPDRNSGVNNGLPIDTQSPGVLSAASAMAETTYSPHSPKLGFCNSLDFGLHSAVHILVGTLTNMGSVAASAQDPIFWMLHCNVDRLWASWNRAGYLNPSDPDFLSNVFWFPGPNGEAVSVKVGDVMSITQLNYTYQEFEPTPPEVEPALSQLDLGSSARLRNLARGESVSTTIVASATAVSLGSGATTVQIKATPAEEVTNRLFNLSPAPPVSDLGAYYLVIRDLQINAQPGVIYTIYLNVSENGFSENLQAQKVGYLNFFSAMPGMGMNEPARFVSYDISDLVKGLDMSAWSAGVSLTIAPSGEPAAGSEPVIGSIAIQKV